MKEALTPHQASRLFWLSYGAEMISGLLFIALCLSHLGFFPIPPRLQFVLTMLLPIAAACLWLIEREFTPHRANHDR